MSKKKKADKAKKAKKSAKKQKAQQAKAWKKWLYQATVTDSPPQPPGPADPTKPLDARVERVWAFLKNQAESPLLDAELPTGAVAVTQDAAASSGRAGRKAEPGRTDHPVLWALAEVLADKAKDAAAVNDRQAKQRWAQGLAELAQHPDKKTAKWARRQIHRLRAASGDDTLAAAVPAHRSGPVAAAGRRMRYPSIIYPYRGLAQTLTLITEPRITTEKTFVALSVIHSPWTGIFEHSGYDIARRQRKDFFADFLKSYQDKPTEVDSSFAAGQIRRSVRAHQRRGKSAPAEIMLVLNEIAHLEDSPSEGATPHPALDLLSAVQTKEPLAPTETARYLDRWPLDELLPPQPEWETLLPKLETGTESGLSLTGRFLAHRRKELISEALAAALTPAALAAYANVFKDTAYLLYRHSGASTPSAQAVWCARMGRYLEAPNALRESAFFTTMVFRLAAMAEKFHAMKTQHAQNRGRPLGADPGAALHPGPAFGPGVFPGGPSKGAFSGAAQGAFPGGPADAFLGAMPTPDALEPTAEANTNPNANTDSSSNEKQSGLILPGSEDFHT
jgi:hypothetical protein